MTTGSGKTEEAALRDVIEALRTKISHGILRDDKGQFVKDDVLLRLASAAPELNGWSAGPNCHIWRTSASPTWCELCRVDFSVHIAGAICQKSFNAVKASDGVYFDTEDEDKLYSEM